MYRLLVVNMKKRNHLEDLGVDGMAILKWIYSKLDVGCGLEYFVSG